MPLPPDIWRWIGTIVQISTAGGCRDNTVLTTVARKFAQNATRIPLAWGFKLANSETSCDKIESGQLYPSEIWQP